MADHRASFSNSLFGAKLEFPLYQDPSGKDGRTGFQVITTARQFPLKEDVIKQLFAVGEVIQPWDLQLDLNRVHKHSSFAIPNVWQASMMNEDFWAVSVAKFGIRALQVPKDIETKNLFHPAWSMKSALPMKTTCPTAKNTDEHKLKKKHDRINRNLGIPKAQSTAHPVDVQADPEGNAAQVGKLIENRRSLWDEMRRDWYPDMHADWKKLPHANIDFREDLRLITEEYFVRRSEFDEYRAHEIAQRWIMMPSFWKDADKVPATFKSNAHMCEAIGHAVMAALPARKEEKRCLRTGTVDLRKGAETWRLSKEAKASKMPIKPFETWWSDDPTPEFVLPVRHVGNSYKDVLEARVSRLWEAMRALGEYEEAGATTAVSRPLRTQIQHSLHVLNDEMVQEILDTRYLEETSRDGPVPSRGVERWLDMFFRLADYTYEKKPVAPSMQKPESMILSKKRQEKMRAREGSPPSSRESSPERVGELKGPNKEYWSVGEVADHIFMADLWILVWDGKDYLVYDVTGELDPTPL